PPWMSLDDRLDVPDAKSDCSTSATRSPRNAASRAMPAPLMPPPMTRRSKRSRSRPSSAASRQAGPFTVVTLPDLVPSVTVRQRPAGPLRNAEDLVQLRQHADV